MVWGAVCWTRTGKERALHGQRGGVARWCQVGPAEVRAAWVRGLGAGATVDEMVRGWYQFEDLGFLFETVYGMLKIVKY